MSIRSHFSKSLQDYRTGHELTQDKMSELCGVSPRHYQDLEQGRCMPKLPTTVFIAKKIGMNLEDLKDALSEEDLQKPNQKS